MAGREETITVDPKTEAVFKKKGYVVLTKISEGAFGKVYKARNVNRNQTNAVKVMNLQKMKEKNVDEAFLQREINALVKIRHPNVLEVQDIFRSKGQLYVFMEFAPNGTLTKRVEKQGHLSEPVSKRWFKQCVSALHCMHVVHHICHRDIKTDNVLFDGEDNAKLSDFGFSREWDDSQPLARTWLGTTPYFAPEIVGKRQRGYDPFKYDVWSMGVLLFVMLNGRFPFSYKLTKTEPRTLLGEMKEGGYKQRYRPGVKISPQVKSLIDIMFTYFPEERPDIVTVKKHPWLK